MIFNPEPNKQAVEICFSRKNEKDNNPSLRFNGDNIETGIT